MKVKLATVGLKGTSAYSQSKMYEVPKLREETYDGYEERTWRQRLHVNPDGHVMIPPSAFKICLSDTAKYLGKKIPGARNRTYAKHFEAGIFVSEPLVLPISVNDVQFERLFVPSDGRRGGGSRVWKYFPVMQAWEGTVSFYILDEIINREVFYEHLKWAGQIIGIGRFRPQNNGWYGRFKPYKLDWQELTEDEDLAA